MRTLILFLLTSVSALAQSEITIPLPAGFTPHSASVFHINADQAQLSESQFRVDGNKVALTAPQSGLRSGIIKNAEGQTLIAPLQNDSEKKLLPLCPDNISQKNLGGTQPALLQALIQVRGEKRAVFSQKVSELLSGDFLEKLNRLEEAFGLQGSTPFSSNLDPYELSERISALAVVLSNMEKSESK